MVNIYTLIGLILFSLVFIVGLIGNGLLIFIVLCQKNLRTIPNLLVVSLAFGDFLFVLFCVPFGAIAYSLKDYPFSTGYCRFENFIINLSLGVSVFSLLALSSDRYNIIARPFSSHTNDPSIKLKLVVTFIWIISALFALPETIYSGVITETITRPDNTTAILSSCWSPNEGSLLLNGKFMIIRQILRLIIYYLMPFVCILFFYSMIARTLFQTKHAIYSPKSSGVLNNDEHRSNLVRNGREIFSTNQEKKSRQQLQARHKVAKIVLILCLVFFVCWLPKQIHDLYWFIGVLVYSARWNHFWQINKTLALVLTYVYSCINPIALYFLSSTFRHFYQRYLCFWSNTNCCTKKPSMTRRRTEELTSMKDDRHHSSEMNTMTTVYCDLNRIKTPDYS